MSIAVKQLEQIFKSSNLTLVYPKGHVICSQGDPFTHVLMIKEGMVKIYDIDETGTERTITIFARDSIFPITWLLHDPPEHHLYYYEAFIPATCYKMPLADLKAAVLGRPELMGVLLDVLTKSYLSFVGRVQNLEKSHMHERLEFILYWLAQRVGSDHEGSVVRIDAAITQEDVARLAGVTRESMSHEINKARDQQLYWKSGGSTYIDTAKINTRVLPKVFEREF